MLVLDHMIIEHFADRGSCKLSGRIRDDDHLMSGRFDRSGLMRRDMTRIGRDHSLERAQNMFEDRLIADRPADHEMNICIRIRHFGTKHFHRFLCIIILSITIIVCMICFFEKFQYFGNASLSIIIFKK